MVKYTTIAHGYISRPSPDIGSAIRVNPIFTDRQAEAVFWSHTDFHASPEHHKMIPIIEDEDMLTRLYVP